MRLFILCYRKLVVPSCGYSKVTPFHALLQNYGVSRMDMLLVEFDNVYVTQKSIKWRIMVDHLVENFVVDMN